VAALARGWLTEDLLSRDLREKALGTSDRYALGWWRFLVEPASADVDETARGQTAFDGTRTERTGSEAILKLGSSSFGMVGFTGSSCWVDPSRGLVAVLLAHRQQSGLDLGPWRQRFHQLAMSFCDFPLR
jgi:CubicO group peptidase (beta-lactamase class C family)